jgi:hypothetical protein
MEFNYTCFTTYLVCVLITGIHGRKDHIEELVIKLNRLLNEELILYMKAQVVWLGVAVHSSLESVFLAFFEDNL